MIACVGQQAISGKRVPNGFEDRALPHFERKGNTARDVSAFGDGVRRPVDDCFSPLLCFEWGKDILSFFA